MAVVISDRWRTSEDATPLLRLAGELHPIAKRLLLIDWGGWREPSERILVIGRQSRGAREAEPRCERKGADLFHVRGGKVTRLVIYFDFRNALADLGVEE